MKTAIKPHTSNDSPQQLERQLARLSDILVDTTDAVVSSDKDFILTSWNRAAEKIFGWKVEEVIGRSAQEVFLTEFLGMKRSEVVNSLMATGHFRGEMIQYTKHGKPVHVEHNTSAMRDVGGQILAYVTVIRDVSEHRQIEAALRAGEEQFRTSVETLLDGFAIFSSIRDEAGRIVDFRYAYINTAGCRLNRRSREEQIGHTLLELLPMHKETGLFDQYVQVVESGQPLIKENLIYKDIYGGGQRLARAFDIRAMKLGDGFVAHWRDVTARKRLEQSESQQRILAETLRDIAKSLNSILRCEEILDKILFQLARVVPYDTANLMLVEQGVAAVARCRGYKERGLAEPSSAHRLVVAETKNLHWMARHGRPQAIPDTRQSAEWINLPGSAWIKSYAGAPLRAKGNTLGFLNINSATPGFCSQEVAERLQTFADHAAIALENARLFEDLQHFARRQSLLNDITHTAISAPDKPKLLQRLADRLGELIQADSAYLALWDEARQRVIPAAAYGPLKGAYPFFEIQPGETTMTESVLKSGQVIAVTDVFNSPYISAHSAAQFPTQSLLGLPLVADGKKLGIALIGFNQTHTFTTEEIDIATQAANQIALAIEKAYLLESERERAALLTRANSLILALGRVAAQIETASDPDEVMSTLGTELHKLNIECLVALLSAENQELRIRYLPLPSRVLALAENIAGVKGRDFPLSRERFCAYDRVIQEKQPVFSAGLENVIDAALPGLTPNLRRRLMKVIGITPATRVIFLPLVAREKILGTLWMWGDELNESDLPAAAVFASQVATSLENARLYREIQRLAITDELTGLYNRRGVLELGHQAFKRATRYDRPLSAVLIDIDHFKNINDSFGHIVGDQVLKLMGEQFQRHLRGTDLAGRFGGEEFLLLLPETKIKSAYNVAERLRFIITEMEIPSEQTNIEITISMGIAERKAGMQELTELIHQADEALYAAKQSGRNRVQLFGPNNQQGPPST